MIVEPLYDWPPKIISMSCYLIFVPPFITESLLRPHIPTFEDIEAVYQNLTPNLWHWTLPSKEYLRFWLNDKPE